MNSLKFYFKYILSPSDFIRPVCLPYEDNYNEAYSGKNLYLSGWGFTTVKNSEKSTGIKGVIKLINF